MNGEGLRLPAVTTPSIGDFVFFALFVMSGDALIAAGSRTW